MYRVLQRGIQYQNRQATKGTFTLSNNKDNKRIRKGTRITGCIAVYKYIINKLKQNSCISCIYSQFRTTP